MAIKDTTRKPYIEDNDENIFIGIDLPFRKSNSIEGYFASTSTTIEAVKNNIRNLVNTHQGERLMQPQLGINLRKYLFEQFSDDKDFDFEKHKQEFIDNMDMLKTMSVQEQTLYKKWQEFNKSEKLRSKADKLDKVQQQMWTPTDI